MYYEVEVDDDVILDEVFNNSKLRETAKRELFDEAMEDLVDTQSFVESALSDLKRMDYFAHQRLVERLRDKELI